MIKALRPDPEERFQSAGELRDAIQHALVKINPTLSSDNLGSFMRGLFADEVAEQRRVAARAEATDLEPWADLLTTQSATTVSYALAHMPLIAPPQTSLVRRPLSAPPVHRPKRRNRSALVAALVLAGMLIGGTVLALVVGDEPASGDQTAAGTVADEPGSADPAAPDQPGAEADGTSTGDEPDGFD